MFLCCSGLTGIVSKLDQETEHAVVGALLIKYMCAACARCLQQQPAATACSGKRDVRSHNFSLAPRGLAIRSILLHIISYDIICYNIISYMFVPSRREVPCKNNETWSSAVFRYSSLYIYIYIYTITVLDVPKPRCGGAPNLCEDIY